MLPQARPDAQPDGPEPACDLMIFLLYTDSALAAREVAATLSHSPHWFREAAIEACLVRMTMAGNSPEIEHATVTTRRAVEALLISELHDTTPASHLYGDGGEKLTLADIAAKTLAAGWPTQYRFDYKAAPPARSAQITTIRAAYKPEPAPPETDNDKGR